MQKSRVFHLASWILGLLWLLLPCTAFATDYYYETHPKPHEGYEVKDDKIYYRSGNAGLVLELADANKIAAFYTERHAAVQNPFALMDEEVQHGTIFLLTLINRTHSDLTFTPGYVVLRIKDQGFFAMDFTVLIPYLDPLDSGERRMMEDTVFHSPEIIKPGKAIQKFIIFPGLPGKYGDYKVSFDYLFFGNKEAKIDFFFERQKLKMN